MDSRLKDLRKILKEETLDAVFISSLPNITYLTGYSGFSSQDRDAFLLITQKEQYIFTHGIYKEDVKQKVKNFTLIEMRRENPINTAIKNLVDEHNIKKLGFESFDLKVAEYDRLTKQLPKKLLKPVDLIEELRIYKSTDEIAALKKACKLGDKAFTYILTQLKNGITESELAARLEFYIKSQGADISFETIVAFEENAAHPHHVPTTKKLTNNSFVLFDFGVLYENYCSDMTRTVSFGKASEEKKRIYETVYNAQKKAIEFLNSQLSSLSSGNKKLKTSNIDKAAREYIISCGYPSIPHSLGHGIGLEVHEGPRLTPVSDEILEEGMVFSIEPGIYLHGNTGVRIEDLFAIENNSLIQLTTSPSNLLEL